MGKPYYKHHVFFCTNQRENGVRCCQDHNASAIRAYAKDKVKAAGLTVPGGARMNAAGCLNRCDKGPVMVVYPEGIWYRYSCAEDIDEIVEQHLLKGRVVKRLQLVE
ncbi:MAG TPA: (2Fe-2S) ferredoxin domain-containing protein [Gammaproteobacteria bacterium]|nr:(2Fe-2S) ferredoxin domain-containing protein [Gammaproteobacteria bacterium]